MNWFLKKIGSADGFIRKKQGDVVAAGDNAIRLECGEIWIESKNGKLGDSEDSFLFVYTQINPAKENFRLSARLTAYTETPDYQTGYGIMVCDTDYSEFPECRHRNQLLAGVFGRNHTAGLRVVSGYTNPDAIHFDPARNYDASRLFTEAGNIEAWNREHNIILEKTDKGFFASFDGIIAEFPGCDFLMEQEANHLYVGFAAAGPVSLRIDEVEWSISPGKLSITPLGIIIHRLPDYPFSREISFKTADIPKKTGIFYASPGGDASGEGTLDSPYDLYTAIAAAGPGSTIMLMDGRYCADEPYYISKAQSGSKEYPVSIKAANRHKAVIDGARQKLKTPAFLLQADYWHVEGICVTGSPSCGIFVSGSHNEIRDCRISKNGDTGLLICAWPSSAREEWPADNLIVDCDSFGNCDEVRKNADGFGAKLRVGSGNRFLRCMAFGNIDDGFDLYSKSVIGSIEAVHLDQCVAFRNGYLSGERKRPAGIGFKLGGENQRITHVACNCVAYENGRRGFSTNSNPSCRLYRCTAFHNGDGKRGSQFAFSAARNQPREWVKRGLLPICVMWPRRGHNNQKDACLRDEAGTIKMKEEFRIWNKFLHIGANLENPDIPGRM